MGFFYRKHEKHTDMVVVRDEAYGKKHLIIGGPNTAIRYIDPRGSITTVLFIMMYDAIYSNGDHPVAECADFAGALKDLQEVLGRNEMLHDWLLMRFIERHPGLTLHLCTASDWDVAYYDEQRIGKKTDIMKLDIDYISAVGDDGMVISVDEFVAKLNDDFKYDTYRKDFPDDPVGHNEA